MISRFGPFEYSNSSNEFGVTLMSDLHLGASDTDEARIKRELDQAKENGNLILINGDWAELIVHGDRKRYVSSLPTEDVAVAPAQVDKYIDKAAAFLKPYAKNIGLIGSGNHETAIQKYHGIDPTKHLIDKLGGKIVHGGYTGGVVLSFHRKGADRPSGVQTFRIWYHHGFGGSAPVTKGVIDYARIASYVEDADVVWMGHAHQRTLHQTVVQRFPRQGSEFVHKSLWSLRTSHYRKHNEPQVDKEGYYRPDWNRERGAAPAPSGGANLLLRVSDHEIKSTFQLEE